MAKLLQINVTANIGSTGKIAEQINVLAQQNGWQTYIAYGQSAGDSQSQLIHVGSSLEMYEHGLESRLLDNHGCASRLATYRFIRQLQFLRPDIIHLHNVHGYYLNYRILFRYLTKIKTPLVWTLHDCWAFTGHCAYFDYSKCERWKTGCYSPCPNKKCYPKALFRDSVKKNYHNKRELFTSLSNLTLVPVSEWLRDKVRHSFLSDFPMKVISNGIDINIFSIQNNTIEIRARYGLVNNYILLGVASVWDERKGFEDYIKLRALLPEEYIIVLVGVTQQQKNLLPQGCLGICRTRDQQELAELYSISDILINFTYEDTYPTVNLESIACGTPVLTYDTGGSIEAITEDTGWIVSQGNLNGAVQIIKANCPKLAIKQSLCREYAEVHFNKDDCFKQYISLYQNIINN